MPRKAKEKTDKKETKEKTPKKAKSKKKASSESAQPHVNIGLVGHVDHGKTTLTEKLSGKWTDTHSEELKRGITIRLGYAETTLRKCPDCKEPYCYTTLEKCEHCKKPTKTITKLSIVDAPGHESLMATMLSGATLMDGVLLLVAANETCPQPQTREHLMALEIMGIDNVIIIQNKVDLVKEEQAQKNYEEIKSFLKGTKFENAPIIPMAARYNVNLDVLVKAMIETFPVPERDSNLDPLFFVARSFDINKPGSDPTSGLIGGVLGGALTRGKLNVGEEIEIKPGRKREKENKITYTPLTTTITGLQSGKTKLDEALPGGSLGISTTLDPALVKSDALTGSIVGHKGKLPPVWDELNLETHLLERVVGAKNELVVEPIKIGEALMLNVNAAATVGVVTKLGKNSFTCKLKLPVCAEAGSKVTISRRVANRFRLIGYGVLKA
jgi:translation initiation factor 2 subunit 3